MTPLYAVRKRREKSVTLGLSEWKYDVGSEDTGFNPDTQLMREAMGNVSFYSSFSFTSIQYHCCGVSDLLRIVSLLGSA